jgi:hypothetical protein
MAGMEYAPLRSNNTQVENMQKQTSENELGQKISPTKTDL